MELWDIYDKDRYKVGKTIARGCELKEGEFHLVVHICIFNSMGQMLIQQRQPFKEGWSNMWDITVGGSSVAGETSAQAAERELYEEIGYSANLSEERPFMTINFNHGFDDIYIIEDDVDLDSLVLQYEEVQRVRWASREEVIQMINDGIFIPYYSNLINLLFEMRKSRGGVDQTK